MTPLRHQRTIARSAIVEGFGYWSGRDVRLEFQPAAPNSGVTFVLAELGAAPCRISVGCVNRIDQARRTIVCNGNARVEMIEHVMAALSGLEIDNCEIWASAPEMPGADGSALPFVAALDSAGVLEQNAFTTPLLVKQTVRCGDERCWVEAQPTQNGVLSIEFHLDYGRGNAIGRQSFAAELSPEQFRYEIAPARTFVLRQEADAMRAQGKGTRVTTRDLLIFDDEGPLDNPLRFPDECVRHKILDVVGDLALIGRPLVGHIVAYRSGHQLNGALAEALVAQDSEFTRRYRRSA